MFKGTTGIDSVIEFGANIGLNLLAVKSLIPHVECSAIEINNKAADELLKNIPDANIFRQSIFDFTPDRKWDLAFTKGVLIHINPDMLSNAYDIIYHSSSKYILICEYYNPTPVEVLYRGYSQRLFKRDFAGELLDSFYNLSLIDYGFVYHRDNNFKQDDMNWFLMEKR